MGEKRVGFHEEEQLQQQQQQQDYSDGEAENDKRPVSKLHRRDTPHHLKNKRVQQHLTDKAANVILSKLKEMPQPVIDEVSPHIEMNPMPLVQDVGLPVIDHYPEMAQNGIDLSAHVAGGEFFFHYLYLGSHELAHKYAMNPHVMLQLRKRSISGKFYNWVLKEQFEESYLGFSTAQSRCGAFRLPHNLHKRRTNGGAVCYHKDKKFDTRAQESTVKRSGGSQVIENFSRACDSTLQALFISDKKCARSTLHTHIKKIH